MFTERRKGSEWESVHFHHVKKKNWSIVVSFFLGALSSITSHLSSKSKVNVNKVPVEYLPGQKIKKKKITVLHILNTYCMYFHSFSSLPEEVIHTSLEFYWRRSDRRLDVNISSQWILCSLMSGVHCYVMLTVTNFTWWENLLWWSNWMEVGM